MNGVFLFTGGLALIRSHNNWTVDWTILITEQTHIGTFACRTFPRDTKASKRAKIFYWK